MLPAGGLLGLCFALVDTAGSPTLLGRLLAGVSFGLISAIANLLLGLGAYVLLAIVLWVRLAVRFPKVEESAPRLIGWLLLYCSLLSVGILSVFRSDLEAALFSSGLLLLSLVPPRVIVPSLRPGVFAA